MFNCGKNLLLVGLSLIMPIGCGHRQSTVISSPVARIVTAPASPAIANALPTTMPQSLMMLPPSAGPGPMTHYHDKGIAFDYPACWVPDKAQTACFAICAPKAGCNSYSSLSLDVPKLPWHLPGMITVGMVSRGYIDDLKSNQIHDAVVNDQHPITVCGCTGREIISKGHENGTVSIDIAIVLIHSDRVYILSADSDDAGYQTAKKTLDAAVNSLQWIK